MFLLEFYYKKVQLQELIFKGRKVKRGLDILIPSLKFPPAKGADSDPRAQLKT